MKKITALLLIAVLAAAMCACNAVRDQLIDIEATADPAQVDTASIRESFDKAIAYVEAAIDTSGMSTQIQDDDGGLYLYKYWTYDQDTENAGLSGSIAVGGKTIEIAETTANDLKELGFSSEIFGTVVDPGVSAASIIESDGKSCNVSFAVNKTDKAISVDVLPVYQVTLTAESYFLPFEYSGLTAESTLKDVIDKLGRPNGRMEVAADDYSTVIELVYDDILNEGDTEIDNRLSLRMEYSAENDTATVFQLDLAREESEAISE